jgi:hypothetical protein
VVHLLLSNLLTGKTCDRELVQSNLIQSKVSFLRGKKKKKKKALGILQNAQAIQIIIFFCYLNALVSELNQSFGDVDTIDYQLNAIIRDRSAINYSCVYLPLLLESSFFDHFHINS